MSEQNLLLLDGNSLINRAFYAIYGRHNLTAPDGFPTGALFVFCNMYWRFIDELHPTHIVAAFDRREPTFRHQAYPLYKATRKPMPDDLAVQIPVLKDLLRALGVCCLECPGFEADDILGSLAVWGSSHMPVNLVTGDKDSFQLASKQVTILQPVTRSGKTDIERYDPAAIMDRYQLSPAQIIDLKALMGDPSDNIPGVHGVGEKGAIGLLRQYETLDGVYEALNQIKGSIGQKLAAGREMAYMSRDLATICLTAPIAKNLDDYRVQAPDAAALIELFNRLGFSKFLTRFNFAAPGTDQADHTAWLTCESGNLEQLSRDLESARDQWPAFWLEEDQPVFWLTDQNGVRKLENITWPDFWQVVENSGCRPVFYDYKRFLRQTGLTGLRSGVHDVLISAYLLNQLDGKPDLNRLYQQATGKTMPEEAAAGANNNNDSRNGAGEQQDLFSLAGAPEQDLPEKTADCAEQDRQIAVRLHVLREIALKQRELLVERHLEYLADTVEFPLAAVLADMEQCGFALDLSVLQNLAVEMSARQEVLQTEIYQLCGLTFNLNSPKQLSEVLFQNMGLTTGKKRSGGTYSTDSDELERLAGEHPAVPLIIEHRQLAKLRSTYVEGLMKVVDPADGRVHTTFNQTLTTTGRLSSSEPNLQNIPIRMAAGQLIRRAFIAAPGCLLLDADYSQIELRLLAHLSGDPAMTEAFVRAEDIHMNTACRIFDKPADEITSEMRSVAKTMNFSIVYGISDFGLARDLGVTVRQAHHYIVEYEEHYPNIRPYLNSLIEQAYKTGYVETLFGRRRYLPELKAANRNIRQFGERAAMNTPVQGTAADLIKIAMVRAAAALKEANLTARLILQVHDELIVECPEGEADQAADLLRNEMEHAMALSVPLLADVRRGARWADCK
ncbi:MAG: DNA polymerase I [Clostridiaceae bacterium]|nr:DNA polymerase I [Clostridiaceae bacterium]